MRLHLFLAAALCASPWLSAASRADDAEQIITLGSYVGAAESAAGGRTARDVFERSGFEDIAQALVAHPINIGAEFNTDSATQNDTSGTTNVNLRGLGLDATLVLLDGARFTVSSVSADDGATFVDLNSLIPAIALESVEVFADGGSALYGSDALAGVVNVSTRKDFTGFEVTAERRELTEYGANGSDWIGGAIWGTQTERTRLAAALGYMDRKSLEGLDVPFAFNSGLSALGQPGAYAVGLPDGTSATVIDRDCEAAGGQPLVTGDPIEGVGTPGFCRLDFARFFSVVNNERRLQGWADGAVELANGATLDAQFVLSKNEIERGNSPSLPNLDFPTLPANNPGNYFGQDVVWFGRPFGNAAGSARREFEHLTGRLLIGLENNVTGGGRDWNLRAELGYSRNEVETTITDTLRGPFNAAIAGYGGPDCPSDAPAQGIEPGDRREGCYFFNPFGSGVLVMDPTAARFNAPVVIDSLIGENIRTGETDLWTLEARAITTELAAFPAGSARGAFGAQIRHASTSTDHGEAFNNEEFLFIIGGADFDGELTSYAAYGEVDVPLSKTVALQAAARIEGDDATAALAPRLALRWRPTANLAVRGTLSRSFRTPSLFERVSASTTLENLRVGPSGLFRAVVTAGSDDLDPEDAFTTTLGMRWTPGPARFSVDLWRYDVEDLIVEESAQSIIDADLADDGALNDPRVELSTTGDVRRVTANFVNAPSVETEGVDITAGAVFDVAGGALSLDANATITTKFDLTDPVTGADIDALGSRNFSNFARSQPEWRAGMTASWDRGPVTLTAGVRHVDGYADDENDAPIDAWTVGDVQASVTLSNGRGFNTLTVGVNNVTNEDPPFVATPLGYDTKVHDPRGRIAYARLTASF